MGFVGLTFELGACVLTTFDEDGFLTAQPDGLGDEPRLAGYELHHAFGFASRPIDPETDSTGGIIEGRACNLLIATLGNETHAWLAADPRYINKFPQLKKGSSVQYASDGVFSVLDPETHTWTLYVPYAFDASGTPTKAHVITVGKDGNSKPIVELVSGEGPSITILEKSLVAKNAGGSAWIEINDNGTNIIGPLKAHGGADLGGTASVPLAKAADLIVWAANVNASLNTLGAPIAALSPTVATTLTKGA